MAVYLITFSCYGRYLPGMDGTVDSHHRQFGQPYNEANRALLAYSERNLKETPYSMDEAVRGLVQDAIIANAAKRGWSVLALHVRTTHVHVVVEASCAPEKAMTSFKAAASYSLNQSGWDGVRHKRWARHGSTRYLLTSADVRNAVRYVADKQGEPMAVHVASG